MFSEEDRRRLEIQTLAMVLVADSDVVTNCTDNKAAANYLPTARRIVAAAVQAIELGSIYGNRSTVGPTPPLFDQQTPPTDDQPPPAA